MFLWAPPRVSPQRDGHSQIPPPFLTPLCPCSRFLPSSGCTALEAAGLGGGEPGGQPQRAGSERGAGLGALLQAPSPIIAQRGCSLLPSPLTSLGPSVSRSHRGQTDPEYVPQAGRHGRSPRALWEWICKLSVRGSGLGAPALCISPSAPRSYTIPICPQ